MESPVERMVREIVKVRNPALYAELEREGELDQFIYYRAAIISSAVDAQRRREKWDFLPHREMITKINDARALASRAMLKEMQLEPA